MDHHGQLLADRLEEDQHTGYLYTATGTAGTGSDHHQKQKDRLRQLRPHIEIRGGKSGERRWRAAKLAGLKEVPVIIRNYTEQEIVEISLIENIQREDLNPIEEAQAYKRLLTEFHLKQDEVAERVSKSRAAVTNSIRLLKLNEDVQRMVVDEMISTGHARALLAVENPEEQYNLAQRIFDEKLSVRDVEKLVKNLHKPAKPKKTDDKTMQVIYQDIEEKLKQKLGRKVTVTSRGEGSGKIEIEFYNHEDLDRLLDVLNK